MEILRLFWNKVEFYDISSSMIKHARGLTITLYKPKKELVYSSGY